MCTFVIPLQLSRRFRSFVIFCKGDETFTPDVHVRVNPEDKKTHFTPKKEGMSDVCLGVQRWLKVQVSSTVFWLKLGLG